MNSVIKEVETLEDSKILWQLPESWKWKRLDEVCQINPRRPKITRRPDAPTSFLPMSGIDEVEGVLFKLEVRPYQDIYKGFTYFEEGDILFAKITPCMENGKCAIASSLLDTIGFGSTEFHVLRPKSCVTAEWVHKFLRRFSFRLEAKNHFRGAIGQQRVPAAFIESSLIPVPPSIDIEHYILGRIQVLLAEVRKSRNLIDQMRGDANQVMEKALEELFRNLDSTRQPLINVIESKPRNGWSPKCDDDPNGIPVLKLGAILRFRYNPNEFKRTSLPVVQNAHYWLQPADILISRSNTLELVGHAAIYPGNPFPCIYPDLMMRMRVNNSKADSSFIIYWLQTKEVREFIKSRASGASPTMKKIKQSDVCDIPFPTISVEEQRRFATHLDSIQSEVDKIRQILEQDAKLLDQLEQSILEQAFQGKL